MVERYCLGFSERFIRIYILYKTNSKLEIAMKKQFIVLGVALIFLTVSLSGCLEENNDNQKDLSDLENIIEIWEENNFDFFVISEDNVSIYTNKIEYKPEDIIEIIVKNYLKKPIKYLNNISCGLQIFLNGKWENVYNSENWGKQTELETDMQLGYNLTHQNKIGIYRVAFYYKENITLENEEIGKVTCYDITEELYELLVNGNWVKTNDSGCVSCDACGCTCTSYDVWTIDEKATIDITYVSCYGTYYTVRYNNKEYRLNSEFYDSSGYYVVASPKGMASPKGIWDVSYSNAFMVIE